MTVKLKKIDYVLESMAEKGWGTFIDEVSGIEDYTEALIEVLENYKEQQ